MATVDYASLIQSAVLTAIQAWTSHITAWACTVMDAVEPCDSSKFPAAVVCLPTEQTAESIANELQLVTYAGDIVLFLAEIDGADADAQQALVMAELRRRLAAVEVTTPGVEKNAIRLTVVDYVARGQDQAIRLRYTVPATVEV